MKNNKKNRWSGILCLMFRKIKNRLFRRLIFKYVRSFEGGEYISNTLREIFRKHYGVSVGKYSHGGCFVPGAYDRFTTVGRYCSIAMTSSGMNRNHPMGFKSMHAYFFNPVLGVAEKDPVEYIPLEIGNDVWIGHNAIIMPNVTQICDGAVIGAGAVVNKNVPPYAVVVGNPGRVVRYRFSEERIRDLLEEKWWEKELEELKGHIEDFQSHAVLSEGGSPSAEE
jgi:virginiamycin A acetyltransferase